MSAAACTTVVLESAVARYGEHHGVGPVSAQLESPGLIWLTGSNGSGKSTLLRLIAGLQRPVEGTVSWASGSSPISPATLRRERTLSSPDIHLYAELSLEENVEFVARMRGLTDPSGHARRALAEAGLEDRAGDYPSELSTGMRQRLKLALAWMAAPALLLLDEPTSNLDAVGREWVWQNVRRHAATSLCVVATNETIEMKDTDGHLDLGTAHSW